MQKTDGENPHKIHSFQEEMPSETHSLVHCEGVRAQSVSQAN